MMPMSVLAELLERVEGVIREFSEELVMQLARRDELEFEKEMKNTFITALMEVQNRQKEQRELSKRRRREKGMSLQGTVRTDKVGSMPVKVSHTPTICLFFVILSFFLPYVCKGGCMVAMQ